jgi:hypothetical protein
VKEMPIELSMVTALYHGHTSHRAYLDVYFIVFAAGVLEQLRSRYFPRSTSRHSNITIKSSVVKTGGEARSEAGDLAMSIRRAPSVAG